MARRREPNKPYQDVERDRLAFTLPQLKWREILFVGALVKEGDHYVRDASRPLPRFRDPDLFPLGARFRARVVGQRVRIERIS